MNTEVFTVNQNKGKWTQAEHETFLKGFEIYGNNWNMISTMVTTRTSTQIKTHAQKYHASLSSDARARISENNVEAQRKHRESLSPNTKARIQESNTAAQQKHRKFISSDTKAHIRERNMAEQQKHRQKFMTEEEKKIEAQIKEYAANLPSAIDIDQLTVKI